MSNGTFPIRLTEIDDLTRQDHCHLGKDDNCFYFGEYSARAGFSAGPTNQLIHNFKKSVDRKRKPEWRYKEQSIREAAGCFSKALHPNFLKIATLVPIPPSKAKDHALYDDRLLRMLQQIQSPSKLDIRELILQNGTREKGAHDGDRPGPDELAKSYVVDMKLSKPAPVHIGLFDDVLVTGSSFVAAKHVLQKQFPAALITGLFLARRAIPDPVQFMEIIDDL
jgi:hypothetical protein